MGFKHSDVLRLLLAKAKSSQVANFQKAQINASCKEPRAQYSNKKQCRKRRAYEAADSGTPPSISSSHLSSHPPAHSTIQPSSHQTSRSLPTNPPNTHPPTYQPAHPTPIQLLPAHLLTLPPNLQRTTRPPTHTSTHPSTHPPAHSPTPPNKPPNHHTTTRPPDRPFALCYSGGSEGYKGFNCCWLVLVSACGSGWSVGASAEDILPFVAERVRDDAVTQKKIWPMN